MPKFSINGVSIYYEVHGEGFPLLWSHEFAGDYSSWEPQVNFFSRRYQVITYSARGYLPSDVPHSPDAYSQEQSVEDVRLLMIGLNIEQAFIGGLSMGGNVALNFALTYPAMAKAIIVASAGSGSDNPEQFREEGDQLAVRLLRSGMAPVANDYARGPARVQFLRKDPMGWHKFHQGLASHIALGSALTYRGVQMKRPPIYDLEEKMKQLQVPTLVMIGDEDDACVNPAIFMKRVIPRCGLAVFPKSGHAINLEEPALFNQTVLDFLIEVENGGWRERE
ncbi:MAG: alpha/beta hydrolase [Chloroflexi bacterium]|nr:alpha/beta hydrolase [Chloroflexota bacterium]MDA1218962.1 alpha/beta hydrolase [Chloroflexota bacterium]